MSRCYACCQENCGYHRCSCDCHEVKKVVDAVAGEKWSIADRYFYQAGPLPEDRYPSVAEAKQAVEVAEDRKVFDQLDGKCPCKKHRTYKAIRKPTSGCEECWRFYIRLHP